MNMRKFTQVAYVAGPYSSSSNGKSVEQNIAAARHIAAKLWDDGVVALCPHMNTAGFEELTTLKSKEFVDGDLLLVERCDLVVLTLDWYTSKGAIREVARAIELDIPFYVWPSVPWRIYE